MNCTVCKGSGVQRCTAHELSSDGWKTHEPVELPCVWCDGTGKIDQKQADMIEACRNVWCKCGNPSGRQHAVTRRNTIDTICADCDGALVIG